MATETPLDQIERSTLATLVAQQIRSTVLKGTFPPGSQLSEVALAESLGVSRGPVREALQELVTEGLLKREPHRGVFIPVVTDEDIADIYWAREAIETAAVKHLVLLGSGQEMRRKLDEIVDQMEVAADSGAWADMVDLDMRFHTELVRGAASPRLERMYATLIAETRLCLIMTVASPERFELVDEHRHIASQLESDDPAPAIAAVEIAMRRSVGTLQREHAEQATGDAASR